MIEYYYSKGVMYIFDGLVYTIKIDFPNELFWNDNKIWVNNFGRVPMGICTEFKIFGVDPQPQVRSESIERLLLSLRGSWVWDSDLTVDYAKRKWVGKYEKSPIFLQG